MKKLNLNKKNTIDGESLSREQLKNVLGGTVPITTTGPNPYCDGSTCEGGWTCANGVNSEIEDCQDATKWCIDHGTTGVRCE